jgi:hypothetical protein
MTDDSLQRVAKALETLGDLQREHVDLVRRLLTLQEEARDAQKQLQKSAGKRLGAIFGLIVLILSMIVVLVGLMFRRIM